MANTCFPHVELKNLGNHLAKLRAATTAFPAAPPSFLQWKTTPALQDALTRLSLCGERVRDTATKFSLVLSSTTSGPGIKSISDEMRQSCDSLLAALATLVDPAAEGAVAATAGSGAGAGAGAPLMELYCRQTRAILRATEDLIKHITSASSNLLSSPTPRQSPLGVQTELAPKTGVVWEQCDKLGTLPRCNKVAFRRAFFNHYLAVKDTLREFEDMLQEEVEEEGTEGEEEEEDDDLVEGVQNIGLTEEEEEEEDFFGGERRMKDCERENVKRCLVALGHCGEMVKRVLDTVDEAMTEEGGEGGREEGQEEGERIQRVAEVEESCQGLAAAVVNAADALYPPQIRQELESQLGALVAAAAHTAAAVARLPAGSAARICHQEMEKVRRAVALGVAEGMEAEETEGGEEEEEEKDEDGQAGGEASS